MDRSEAQEGLQQARADLRRLRKHKQLPPLMWLKLAYLQALINNISSQHDIGELLDVEEKQAIEDLPLQTKKRLFIDTIKCLSGRQAIVYCRNERSYLRTDATFFQLFSWFSWEQCYTEISTNQLVLTRQKESKDYFHKFELLRVCISKNFKNQNGKYFLAIDIEGVKYIIGFDEETTCKRIHETLVELINQKRQWQTTLYDNSKFIEEREAERLALPAHRVQRIIYQEEHQHLNFLYQKAKKFEKIEDSDLQQYKNAFGGRILITKSGVVKTQVIIKGLDVFSAASSYVYMKSWNKAIQICEIVGRPRANCLVSILKTKRYSLFSYARGATLAFSFFKPCDCSKEAKESKYYLLIESLPESEAVSGTVAMDFKQVLQFIPNKQDPNSLLVISFTKVDFKGFCSQSDNLAMTLQIAQQIQEYSLFIQSLRPYGKNNSLYFQPAACPCGLVAVNEEVLSTQKSSSLVLQQNRGFNSSILLNPQYQEKTIIAAMQDLCRGLVNEQITDIISSRSFEKYYLKHRFSQKDQTIEVTQGGIINFLNQGTRFQLQNQELVFINKQVLAVQKDILKLVLKKMSVCIMQGKSVMNMSLPVEIFDKRSLLDSITDSYGFLPAYSQRIKAAEDPIQQIKLIAAATMFGHATDPNIQKPFNPILGETYQGRLGDFQVYVQQISHHPPISAVLFKNQHMELSGNVEAVVRIGLNSANLQMRGWFRAKVYSTATEYLVKLPEVQAGGLVYGPRTYRVVNKGCIFQKKNSIYCEFSIGKDKKRVYQVKPIIKFCDITGGVFKVTQQFAKHILSCKKSTAFDGIKPQNIVETYSLISGKWFGDLYFDGVCYKSVKDGPFPIRSQKLKYLLPSDSMWREDIIHRIWKDYQLSNRQKQKLQNLQRNDRRLRQKYKKDK